MEEMISEKGMFCSLLSRDHLAASSRPPGRQTSRKSWRLNVIRRYRGTVK